MNDDSMVIIVNGTRKLRPISKVVITYDEVVAYATGYEHNDGCSQ